MRKPTEPGPPLLRARGIGVVLPGSRSGLLRRPAGTVRVLDRLSLDVGAGDLVWLVGSPGSGAAEAGQVLTGELTPTSGGVELAGRPAARFRRRHRIAARRQVLGIDWEAEPGLDPRRTPVEIVAAAVARTSRAGTVEQLARARRLLVGMGLGAEILDVRSTGLNAADQRSVEAARVLAMVPRVVVYRPAPTLGSHLDGDPVWAALCGARQEAATALVVVCHALPARLGPGDRALIMSGGRVVECLGPGDLQRPLHPCTLALVANWAGGAEAGDSDGADPPEGTSAALDSALHDVGCPFRAGCPRAKAVCTAQMPGLRRPLGASHEVACHFPEDPRGRAFPSAPSEATIASGSEASAMPDEAAPAPRGAMMLAPAGLDDLMVVATGLDEPTAREFAES